MSVHVDILRNEWLIGEQFPIARLYIAHGSLQIDSPDPARWTPVVERALAELALDGDPQEVLSRVAERLHGSHLLATAPHDTDACPHRGWSSARIESVSAQPAPAATG